MESNIIIKILEQQEIERKRDAEQKIFSLSQLSRLNKLVESVDGSISSSLWDLLYFNVNNLYINNNQVCYKSFYKPSKRIVKFLNQYNDLIIQNFNYIMKG